MRSSLQYPFYNDPYDRKLDEIIDKILKGCKKILNRFRFWFSKLPKKVQILFYVWCGWITLQIANHLNINNDIIKFVLQGILFFLGDYYAYKIMQLEKVDNIEEMKK